MRRALVALVVALATTAGCSDDAPDPPSVRTTSGPAIAEHVLVVSIDGLNPAALSPGRTPTLTRLLEQGLGTRNARTEIELTDTLPNHTGMVTGRPVEPAAGGHGVTWNDETDRRTVQEAAGEDVASMFTVVHDAEGSTAVFAGKEKFDLFERSWPDAVDASVIDDDQAALVDQVVEVLDGDQPTLALVHLASPDAAGHETLDFMGPEYLDAVATADADLARVVAAAGDDTVVVVTADHGGEGGGHGEPADADNYTIPFVVAGPGVPPGDLYADRPGFADPGTGRPGYDGPQPVRNCDVANLATGVLGLGAVPGSSCDLGPIAP